MFEALRARLTGGVKIAGVSFSESVYSGASRRFLSGDVFYGDDTLDAIFDTFDFGNTGPYAEITKKAAEIISSSSLLQSTEQLLNYKNESFSLSDRNAKLLAAIIRRINLVHKGEKYIVFNDILIFAPYTDREWEEAEMSEFVQWLKLKAESKEKLNAIKSIVPFI